MVPASDCDDNVGAAKAAAIYFFSDFGIDDEFVGVVHAVLHGGAPNNAVIDLVHTIAPYDTKAGSRALLRCLPSLGPGVVLGVVDPGVGTNRRGIALRTQGNPEWLVGPDNGLLLASAKTLGLQSAWELHRPQTLAHRSSGLTFDARDLFAPATAHLVRGGDPELIGVAIDATQLTTLDDPPPTIFDASALTMRTTVQHIDRFGNVQLNCVLLDRSPLFDSTNTDDELRWTVSTKGGEPTGPVRLIRAFADLGSGEIGLYVDANCFVALAMNQQSAAERFFEISAGVSLEFHRNSEGGFSEMRPPS